MEVLAYFCAVASGIHFYDFSLEEVVAGLRFGCEREPLHAKDPNSIRLGCGLWGTLAERLLLTWHLCSMQDLMLMGMF